MIRGGQEVIIGAVTDPSFGKLVAFGLGGVLVEVLKDITFRLAPATVEDACSMLDGIQAAEMLKGVRGSEPVNREALARMIVGVSELVSDIRDGPESRFRIEGRRNCGRRANCRRFPAEGATLPAW
jgi:acyl-CoA synthetase (NDP forming)